MTAAHLLEVSDLHTVFSSREGAVRAVAGVSFHVDRGETLGIVGESGCGKSATALSIMRLLEHPGRIVSGSIRLEGTELTSLPESAMQQVRGARIAMIFQDPLTSMNPGYRVGWQVAEPLRLHRSKNRAQAGLEAVEMLKRVGIPEAVGRANEYPHQFSGGMRQRAMIGMGLTTAPAMLIADEPTTALDVTIQAQILALLKELNRELGMATVLITHNLGAVANMCERTNIMYAGRIVESGPTEELFADPKHPYTALLLKSVPRLDADEEVSLTPIAGAPPDLAAPPQGCPFHPRCPFAFERCREEMPPLLPSGTSDRLAACWVTQAGGDITSLASDIRRERSVAAPEAEPLLEVKGLETWYASGGKGRHVRAVDGVDLQIAKGETLALVGESGCGKTTLARSIVRLLEPREGQILFDGHDITRQKGRELRRSRRAMAMIFQDPYASLNPRHTVADIVGEPLDVYGLVNSRKERGARVHELLELVGLDPRFGQRYPHEFSGGQRQRVGIARALSVGPELLVADEPVSALDVSIQAQIVNLLDELKQRLNLAMLFISHDIAVMDHLADRIAIVYLGRIMEIGQTRDLIDRPRHPYTEALLSAVPQPGVKRGKRIVLTGDVPSPADPPSGCAFRTRCRYALPACAAELPPLRPVAGDHYTACIRDDVFLPQAAQPRAAVVEFSGGGMR